MWLCYCTAVLEPRMFPKEMAFCVTGLCVYSGDCHVMLQNFSLFVLCNNWQPI